MTNPRTVVISDIHVGAGELDDCDGELEDGLTSFIRDLSTNDGPIELVINGDFLDFVQAPPLTGSDVQDKTPNGERLCFTQTQSASKLVAIMTAHRSIFDALSEFAGSREDRSLIVIPGNHDADFFWPEVRRVLTESFSAKATKHTRFHLERVYRPALAPRAWIEHGHQHDPLNSFFINGTPAWSTDRPPISVDRHGVDRLLECVGTRFMIQFMNRLDKDYPFIDNVKPFNRFLSLFGAAALIPGFGPLRAAVAMWSAISYIARTLVTTPGDLLDKMGDGPEAPGALIQRRLAEMNNDASAAFSRSIEERGFQSARSVRMILEDPDDANELLEFLAENLDLMEQLEANSDGALGAEEGTLALGAGFFGDETKALLTEAASIRQREADVGSILMGHTHEQVRDEEIGYVNTGCWTRYYQFKDEEKTRPWSILKENSFNAFPYALRYGEITPDGRAQMNIYRERKK